MQHRITEGDPDLALRRASRGASRWRNYLALPLALLLCLLALHGLLRIALLVYTGVDLVPLSLWPVILLKGVGFDLAVATTLLAPVLLYEAVLPNRWRAAGLHRGLRVAWLFAAFCLLLFGAVAEFTFWIEFSTRLNFIALDYLIYTNEVVRNVIESYPVVLIFSLIGITAAILAWAVQRRCGPASAQPLGRAQRVLLALVAIALPTAFLSALSVDQMEGLNNAYADELSGNGLFTLAAAARRNELDYLKFYRTQPPQAVAATLSRLGVERAGRTEAAAELRAAAPARQHARHFNRTPRNLVLVSIESLSASFLGSYGDDRALTPNLDALARDGLRFGAVYATGTRTVRGLEALSLGTPPVPGQAIVRRPDNEHLATVGELLEHQGYETLFFYGGYGYFDNMNAYFHGNDYRVIDRTDIPSAQIVFENVWGVADEVLFNTVIDQLDRRADDSRPFFAHVMTTSNHRPFTYPDGRIDIPSPGGRVGAVKYTDHAIGEFIRNAQTRPWFKDTLFVFVADHCASVAGKTKLPVKNYQIPLIFYSPGNLKPGVHAPMISQIDVAPSLLDALGRSGANQFYGRSVFDDGPVLERAFISNYQELGYLRNNKLTVLLPKQKVEVFDIDPATLQATPGAIDAQLLGEAIAYYQSASSAFRAGQLRAPFYAAQ